MFIERCLLNVVVNCVQAPLPLPIIKDAEHLLRDVAQASLPDAGSLFHSEVLAGSVYDLDFKLM